MEVLVCEHCGGNEFEERDGYRVCLYCGSKFVISKKKKVDVTIDLNEDVRRLLRKCKEDPDRATKYATLVLEMDPTNQEAMKYIK